MTTKGRPRKLIEWPQDRPFTVKDVFDIENKNGSKVSKVSIQTKIKEAVKAGEVVFVTQLRQKTGRPTNQYRIRGLVGTEVILKDDPNEVVEAQTAPSVRDLVRDVTKNTW
jgi:hypothetical protein